MPLQAPKHSQCPATLHHGRINAEDGERFGVVSTDGRRYWLKPAAGCLLRPALGDAVLICVEGTSGYILTVLERDSSTPARLSVDGDLHLHLPAGALHIEARDGISLDAGAALAVRSANVLLHSTHACLTTQTLQVSGERADSHWLQRHDTALHAHQTVQVHTAEFGDSRRRVEGHEDLYAGSVSQQVKNDWQLRGETLDLFADITVALDGQRIKLG